MSAEELRRFIGSRVVDADGRPLGRVSAITHHSDGNASALVDGPWPWSAGRLVPLDGAVPVGDVVVVGRRRSMQSTPAGHR